MTRGAVAPELARSHNPQRLSPPDPNRDEISAKPTRAHRSRSKMTVNALNKTG
jgi:hypothetical protein